MMTVIGWLVGLSMFALMAVLVVHVLFALLLIVPSWRIFERAGYSGLLSLFHLVPVIGPFIVMAILAFGDWPNGEGKPAVHAAMMGFDLAAVLGLFGLTSAFAAIALVLAAWMCWRIADKAGLPGWAGAAAILLTLTGIGSVVSLILLWVFAFMRWPRDGVARRRGSSVRRPLHRRARPRARSRRRRPPSRRRARALADRRGWTLAGGGVTLAFDDGRAAYTLTGEGSGAPGELVVADPSVGQPHARLLTAAGRIGLEDLGTPGRDFHRWRKAFARPTGRATSRLSGP